MLRRTKAIVRSCIGRLAYHVSVAARRPYFGDYLAAGQGEHTRYQAMRELLRKELGGANRSHYRILEIGSWAGGSVLVWGEVLREFPLMEAYVFCLDPWRCYKQYIGEEIGSHYDRMRMALRSDRIYALFSHNVRVSGYEDSVISIRGMSDDVLPMLARRSFDLVYIDGNHSYDFFLRDLKNASELVVEGGILCGDDLELQTGDFDQQWAEERRNSDWIRDPLSNMSFHPGISLGIRDFFKRRISCNCGFWAVRFIQNGFADVG